MLMCFIYSGTFFLMLKSDQKHYTNVEKKNQNKIKGIPNSSMIPESHNKK